MATFGPTLGSAGCHDFGARSTYRLHVDVTRSNGAGAGSEVARYGVYLFSCYNLPARPYIEKPVSTRAYVGLQMQRHVIEALHFTHSEVHRRRNTGAVGI